MKIFLQKTGLYLGVILLLHILAGFQADGGTDPYYVRFTTPRQSSMILGSSRAAQGLVPEVLDSVLEGAGYAPTYNYAFTEAHSPYGRIYFESVMRKLEKDSQHGLFLLAVDPWSISSRSPDPNDSTLFRENSLCLNHTPVVNMNPNWVYLLNNYNKGWIHLFQEKSRDLFLHMNGWLEVSIPMDSASVSSRNQRSLEKYRNEFLPVYQVSDYRIQWLKALIRELSGRGKVVLVRIPACDEFLQIEHQYMPEFDSLANKISSELGVSYFSYVDSVSNYIYSDCNHLQKASAAVFSRNLATKIMNNE